MCNDPKYRYEAIPLDPKAGQWMIKRFDGTIGDNGNQNYEERLITVPVDWYEQQVIQKAIAEDSWA